MRTLIHLIQKYRNSIFGVKPDSHGAVTSTLTPLSRVVIRSGPVTSGNKLQRQIQFRFGRLSGNAAEKNMVNLLELG